MDTATKTGIDTAKSASKRILQKTAEATGDLTGNKIANKISSIGKPNEKTKEIEGIYRLLMILDCLEHKKWHHCIKMEFQKIANFLDTTSDGKDLPKFGTKNGLKFMINQKKIATLTK